MCGCVWLCVVVCGCVWLCVVVCGCVWLCVVVCKIVNAAFVPHTQIPSRHVTRHASVNVASRRIYYSYFACAPHTDMPHSAAV